MKENPQQDAARPVDRNRHRIVFLSLGVLGLLSKFWYRPFVRGAAIDDFGLAGVLPTFFMVAFLTVFAGVSARPWRSAAAAFGIIALDEVLQGTVRGPLRDYLLLRGRTFEPWDIVAAAMGAALGWVLAARLIAPPPRAESSGL